MPLPIFLREHLIRAPLLIGAVLAMTAGLTLGSYLKAGELPSLAPSPQILVAEASPQN
jgi:hypothetical protein